MSLAPKRYELRADSFLRPRERIGVRSPAPPSTQVDGEQEGDGMQFPAPVFTSSYRGSISEEIRLASTRTTCNQSRVMALYRLLLFGVSQRRRRRARGR